MKSKTIFIILTIGFFYFSYSSSAFCQQNSNIVGSTYDAEGFLWGTEGQGVLFARDTNVAMDVKNIIQVINDVLKTKLIKIRLHLPMDGKFGPQMCRTRGAVYSGDNQFCMRRDAERFNLDEMVKIFKNNGWSMFPMISHAGTPFFNPPTDNEHVERYVDFVDWFIARYKDDGNIGYIELVNAPSNTWKGTAEQLLMLNNRTYERIKAKYPNIRVGTPGFEYFNDSLSTRDGRDHHSLRDYFLTHDAKFDFWSFHGYPARGRGGLRDIYPPTKVAHIDKFTGIYGIVELRRLFDQKGWFDRTIIDTEHTGITPPGIFSREDDRLNAAYMVQELLLKRTLKIDGRPALAGVIAFKILPRSELMRMGRKINSPMLRQSPRGMTDTQRERDAPPERIKDKHIIGESVFGSLFNDGSVTSAIKAAALLWSKLKEYKHESHLSGSYDAEDRVWIEKFAALNRELYIMFKPFQYREGGRLGFDDHQITYELHLKRTPSSVQLHDIYGNSTSLTPKNIIRDTVGNEPIFLEIRY